MNRWLGLAALTAAMHATPALAQTTPEPEEPAPESAATAAEIPDAPPAPVGETPLTRAEEGVKAYLAKDDELAQSKLDAAYAELPLPSIGVWVARTLGRRGRLLDAQARYQAIVGESDAKTQATLGQARARGLTPPNGKAQKKAKDEATVELASVTARIPTITVRVEGAGDGQAEVTFDRPPGAGGQLEPGPLRIEGRYEEGVIVRNVVLHERDRATVVLDFGAPQAPFGPPAESSSAAPVLGWVLVGVGAAGVAVGGVIAGVALGKLSGLDCDDNVCEESQRDDMDAYNALRLPAGFLIVGGGLVAATGLAVILTANDASNGDVALHLGPGYLGLSGRF